MAATLDRALDEIKVIQQGAGGGCQRAAGLAGDRPVTPKGWTGPKFVDGLQTEGTFRSHQVPFSDMTDAHVKS